MTTETLLQHTDTQAERTVRLLALSRFGSRGWSWTEEVTERGHSVTTEYRTNGEGRGRWRYTWRGVPRQVAGTTQFSLPATREGVLRRFRLVMGGRAKRR